MFIWSIVRFVQDLEDMLGFKPYKVYFYLWKYVSPCCLIVLITASVIEMAISPPGYNAWVQDQVSKTQLYNVYLCYSCLTRGKTRNHTMITLHIGLPVCMLFLCLWGFLQVLRFPLLPDFTQ